MKKYVRNDGFSLLEMLFVVALLMAVSTVAVIRLKASVTLLDADKAANLVASQLRYGRQIALDDRRNVLVEFISPRQIKVTRLDNPTPTVISDVSLPTGYSFALPTGVTSDTPDGYGDDAAVTFNEETTGIFRGDGIFTDDAGIVINGSVFTINGANNTARAVTLTGATGRTKTYRVSGAAWTER